MPPTRLVRKRSFTERIQAWLNPMDFLLWLSEEIETREWNSKLVGTQLGLAMNVAFLLSRANTGYYSSSVDDVFGDGGGSSWLAYLSSTIVWLLVMFSTMNAVYTMKRCRSYRLFEANVEQDQGTPSARRVRVRASPVASSPLRLLTDILSSQSAESRAYPDATRDVWELSVWDPLPISLRIFCLFSPGHALVYMLFLPVAALDARPSVTVFNAVLLQLILSTQMWLLQSRFAQQNKDTSIIQREVMHEYNTKFVHPRLYPTVRDASTQLSHDQYADSESVEVGTPSTLLRRGFQTNPNPNYSKHYDPDGTGSGRSSTSGLNDTAFSTPQLARRSDALGSGIRTSNNRSAAMRRGTPVLPSPLHPASSRVVHSGSQAHPQSRANGSYLGVFSHSNSPLRKAVSMTEPLGRTPTNNSQMAELEQMQAYKDREREREDSRSPLKSARKSVPYGTSAQSPVPWVVRQQRNRVSDERYPSMWQ